MQTVGYSGLCNVHAPTLALLDSAELPNLSFEVVQPGILDGQIDTQPDFIISALS